MNIFKRSFIERKKINEIYNEQDLNKTSIYAFFITFIFLIPIILLCIQLFYLYMMRPYLAVYICGIGLFIVLSIYHIFLYIPLLKINKSEDGKFIYPMLVPLIYYFVGVLIFTTIVALIVVPIFFI